MARNRHQDGVVDELPAQDSFLDLVANIVGIMILLVVIVGIRAASAVIGDAGVAQPNASDLRSADVDKAMTEFTRIASEATQLDRKTMRIALRAEELDEHRISLIGYADEVERELARQRETLSESDKAEFDIRVAIAQAESEFDNLTRERLALESGLENTKTLKNVPTPIARPITHDEIRLWVFDGRVAIMPVDELESLAIADIERRRLPNGISSVGPRGGFVLLFAPVSCTVTTPTGAIGRSTRVIGEFRPVVKNLGEPVSEALEKESNLREELAKFKPNTTAVTFWAPESGFEDVGKLREMVARLGYSTAIRPLHEGFYMQIAPSGSKSRVQ